MKIFKSHQTEQQDLVLKAGIAKTPNKEDNEKMI